MQRITRPKRAEIEEPVDNGVSTVYAWKQDGVFREAPAGLVQVTVKGR